MKLYKYVSLERAIEIIKNRHIQFTLPRHLNDPCDTPINPKLKQSQVIQEPKPDSPFKPFVPGEPISNDWTFGRSLGRIIAEAGMQWLRVFSSSIFGNDHIARSYGLLSLTRTPTNALMWAHYADSHRGVVLAFDAEAAGFCEDESNVIPAHFGNVIYTRVRPSEYLASKHLHSEKFDQTCEFDIQSFERMQRLFLFKALDWAYEEEVRVVKCLTGLSAEMQKNGSGRFHVTNSPEGQRHLFRLPAHSIIEVHVGHRGDSEALRHLNLKGRGIKLFECQVNQDTYQVESFDPEANIDAV